MKNGWIKLHRKILENPISSKPEWAWLWVVLLLLANHEEKESFIWNGKAQVLQSGQLLTGRKKLSILTGIPESTTEDILTYLETQQQIQQQKTTKYRVITILKWNEYQISDNKSDSKATTEQQQSDTFKKRRKKEEKKDTEVPAQSAEGTTGAIIYLFKDINPSYEILYKRKTQHDSARRLLEREGIERIQNAVKFLLFRKSDKFCPQISTPVQLEEKWAALEKYGAGLKRSSQINTNPTWKIWT